MEKETKIIKNQVKRISTIEEHRKRLVEFKAFVSRSDFTINKNGAPLEKQREKFDKLVNERASEIDNF